MMPAPYLGAKHTLGFKPQAVAGTAETTVTTFLATSKVNTKANPSLVPRVAFLGTGVELPGRAGWMAPSGEATCEVHASQPQPWYWALGGNVTTTPGGTNPRLHTITDAGAPIRLTCEADKVYGKSKQADAYISKLVLNAKVGEIALLDLDWLSLGHLEAQALTSTPTFTANPLICTAVSVSVSGSQLFSVDGAQITWDGKLEQKPVLTNVTAGQPQTIRRSQTPEVTGQLDFIDFPTAELTKFLAGTAFAIILELQGATIETTYKEFLRITLPACQYTGGLDTEAAEAVITGSGQFKAGWDTVSGAQIKVEAQNAITSIIT